MDNFTFNFELLNQITNPILLDTLPNDPFFDHELLIHRGQVIKCYKKYCPISQSFVWVGEPTFVSESVYS